MFHVEIRKFPHTACSFNLSEAELSPIVVPWSHGQWIEFGERKWNPQEARLTVLEGPHLAVEDLAMGRGWRNAQHQSEDVTERIMARARASQPGLEIQAAESVAAPSPGVAPATGPGDLTSAEDSTAGLPVAELEPLLGDDPAALLQAWRLAAQRRPELSPSESLELAERTLHSLDAGS